MLRENIELLHSQIRAQQEELFFRNNVEERQPPQNMRFFYDGQFLALQQVANTLEFFLLEEKEL